MVLLPTYRYIDLVSQHAGMSKVLAIMSTVIMFSIFFNFSYIIQYRQKQKSLVKLKTVEKITGTIILGCHPQNDFSSPHRSHNWRHNELLNLSALSLEFHGLDSPLGGRGVGTWYSTCLGAVLITAHNSH